MEAAEGSTREEVGLGGSGGGVTRGERECGAWLVPCVNVISRSVAFPLEHADCASTNLVYARADTTRWACSHSIGPFVLSGSGQRRPTQKKRPRAVPALHALERRFVPQDACQARVRELLPPSARCPTSRLHPKDR